MELKDKKALVLGGRNGLLGMGLAKVLREAGAEVLAVGSADFDVRDPAVLSAFIDREEPALVCNCAAHTQVDQAEDEPEAAGELNRILPGRLARLARDRGFFLVHYSTDFVFNGKKGAPYEEEDPVDPLSVYGATKLEGERAVLETCPDRALVLRTAWLFGPGKINFVKKILALAVERESLNVVCDQTGSPTYAPDLARHTLDLLGTDATGVFHLVNSGLASWCELAAEAVSLAGLNCRVDPIPASDFPAKAVRPAYSVLSTAKFAKATGVTPRPWNTALRDYVFADLPGEDG